jgi:rare lipoprotein A
MRVPAIDPAPRRAAACALAALLAACGSAPQRATPPAQETPAASHPRTEAPLPVLPAAGSGRGGYYQNDGPGENPPPNLRAVADAAVKAEPYVRGAANRPYVVFGQTYTPLLNEQAYSQRGVASWYGKKFHGQRTSSGEAYDMYKMTAAHPTLPIPSYARITSVESGEQVVVRINDRGPFHSSRIVDVSYTAALKLGLLGKGSHEVLLERILPNRADGASRHPLAAASPSTAGALAPVAASALASSAVSANAPSAKPAPPNSGTTERAPIETLAAPGAPVLDPIAALATPVTDAATPLAGEYFVQLGAFNQAERAHQMRHRLNGLDQAFGALEVVNAGALYRLFGGPFTSRTEALRALEAIPAALGLKPFVVRRAAPQ